MTKIAIKKGKWYHTIHGDGLCLEDPVRWRATIRFHVPGQGGAVNLKPKEVKHEIQPPVKGEEE